MQPEHPANQAAERRSEIAHLIRESYTDLLGLMHSPYVDGEEIHRCLIELGHDLHRDSLGMVAEVLGWKCMRLPVANIDGRPKHYLPFAAQTPQRGLWNISEQTAACVANLRKFGRSALA